MSVRSDPDTLPMQVWVVEDNEFLRDTIQELLDQAPRLKCTLAVASCEQAIKALGGQAAPAVVLMDLSLPGMSGQAGIERILQLAPSVLIIVLTVHDDHRSIFDALCAGAIGYLLKPATPDQIVEAIFTAVAGGSPINAVIARKLLAQFSKPDGSAGRYGLTEREREILQLAVEGCTKRQIAARLTLSPHTVDTHLRHIYERLQVRSRSGAVAKAVRERLV